MKQLFQRGNSRVLALLRHTITIFFMVCLLSILDNIVAVKAKICSPGQASSLGWTEPNGDIILRVGMPLEIFCNLNLHKTEPTYSIKDLVFYRNNESVDHRYVTVINETTARLFIENMTESSDWFYCKLARKVAPSTQNGTSSLEYTEPLYEETVCMNNVAVGSKPKDVEHFKCNSSNWEKLSCSWEVPENFVATNYTISYQTPKRAGRAKKYECPNNDDIIHHRCEWTLSTKPPYRRTFEYLLVLIEGQNLFDKNEQSIRFHHYAHIRPKSPQNLEMENKTVSSIFLKWNIGNFHLFDNALSYKVQYTWQSNSNWIGNIYQSKNLTLVNSTVFLNVTGLPYANTLYDFRVCMKPAVAISDEYWSDSVTNVFRTKACPPYTSPKMEVGSFEIVYNSANVRTVYLYWQPLLQLMYNGDDFHYQIFVYENGRELALNASSVNYSYAEFVISLHAHQFKVRSANKEGHANYSTFIHVPAQTDVVKHCSTFTKTDYGNGVYELAWEPPYGSPVKITNYTIFRCESNKERPYQCNGNIDWEHFSPLTTRHNFTVNNSMSYQFAISVNTETSSSGMMWASCTVLHGRVGTVKHVRATYNGTFHINVEWKLECSDKAVIIEGYRIFYCVVSLANKSVCQEKEQNVVVYGGIHRTSCNITNLRPYTHYKISVMILTNDNRTGPRSNEFITRTDDGPPEVAGLTIRVLKETSTTAVIKWDVPKVTNGVLKEYLVIYNGEETKVGANVSEKMLTGLLSYHTYNVTVKACTSMCSEPMNAVLVRTRIGIPGIVSIPQASSNGTHAFVSWNKPSMPAGPRPIYEVVTLKNGVSINSIETEDTKVTVPVPDCKDEKSQLSYEFKVRAKNVDEGVSMQGEWSPAHAVRCVPLDIPVIWKIMACIFVPLFIAAVFIYGGKKGLYKCKQMKSVQVTIPTKFTIPSSTYPIDSKDTELFDSYGLPQMKSADEFCTLVEKTTELVR